MTAGLFSSRMALHQERAQLFGRPVPGAQRRRRHADRNLQNIAPQLQLARRTLEITRSRATASLPNAESCPGSDGVHGCRSARPSARSPAKSASPAASRCATAADFSDRRRPPDDLSAGVVHVDASHADGRDDGHCAQVWLCARASRPSRSVNPTRISRRNHDARVRSARPIVAVVA